MKTSKYLLIEASILPDVYKKVVEVNNYLKSGSASSVSQAVKMAGISRSAYYKYKDKIFEYSEGESNTATISAKLLDNAGVLSSVMNEVYLAGANVLSIHQTSPVNDVADVSITVSLTRAAITTDELIEKIKRISGVTDADLV